LWVLATTVLQRPSAMRSSVSALRYNFVTQ
jgi:hypothetical protein